MGTAISQRNQVAAMLVEATNQLDKEKLKNHRLRMRILEVIKQMTDGNRPPMQRIANSVVRLEDVIEQTDSM